MYFHIFYFHHHNYCHHFFPIKIPSLFSQYVLYSHSSNIIMGIVSVCEVVSGDGTIIGDVIDAVATVMAKLCTVCTNGFCSPAVGARSSSIDYTGTCQDYMSLESLFTLPGHDGISFTQRPLSAVLHGGVTTLSVTV